MGCSITHCSRWLRWYTTYINNPWLLGWEHVGPIPLTVIKSVAGIHLPSSWINDRCVGAGKLRQMRVELYMGVPPKSMVFLKMPCIFGWFGGKKWGSPISRKPPYLKVCHSLPGLSVLVPKNSRVFPPPTSQGAPVGRAAHQRSALLHDHRVDGHGSGECDPQQAGAYGSLGHLGHI